MRRTSGVDNKVFTRKCGEKKSASFGGLGAPRISETHYEPRLKPTQVYTTKSPISIFIEGKEEDSHFLLRRHMNTV